MANFDNSGPSLAFFVYFRLFKQILQLLQLIYVNKWPYSIQCWVSNPQPSGHKSAQLTTRPGLPPWGSFLSVLKRLLLRFRLENPFKNPLRINLLIRANWKDYDCAARYLKLCPNLTNALQSLITTLESDETKFSTLVVRTTLES